MSNSYKDYDEQFKIVIVGSSGVGKSALIVRFVDDKFKDDLLATIGVDFRFRTMFLQEKKVKMQIWDTAGQQNFRTIISAYYRGADAIIIVYDLGNPNTFEEIQQFWIKEIQQNKQPDCEIMLIGNKSDQQIIRKPLQQKITLAKQQLKTDLYFETSAKTSDSVQKAFTELIVKLINRNNSKKDKKQKMVLGKQKQKTSFRQKCCS